MTADLRVQRQRHHCKQAWGNHKVGAERRDLPPALLCLAGASSIATAWDAARRGSALRIHDSSCRPLLAASGLLQTEGLLLLGTMASWLTSFTSTHLAPVVLPQKGGGRSLMPRSLGLALCCPMLPCKFGVSHGEVGWLPASALADPSLAAQLGPEAAESGDTKVEEIAGLHGKTLRRASRWFSPLSSLADLSPLSLVQQTNHIAYFR